MARDYARNNRTSRRNARTGGITPRGGRRPSSQLGMSLNKRSSHFRSFLWLISGVLIGLIIAGITYIKHEHHEPVTTAAQTQEKSTKPNKAAKLKEKLSNKQNAQNHETANSEDSDSKNESLDEEENALTESFNSADENTTAENTNSDQHSKKKMTESSQPQYEFYTMLPKDKIDDPTPAEKEKVEPKNNQTSQYHLQIASMTKFEEADHLKAQLILQGYNANISKQVRHGSTRYRVLVGPFSSSKAAMAQQQNLKKNHISSIIMPA